MSMGVQERGGHPYQVMTVKYMRPVVEIARCVPLLAPTCFGTGDIEQYLSMVDGVYVSGAATNMNPELYGQENLTPEKPQDRDRDLFDIPLVLAAIEMGLPLLGVCRGMQEWNVALGGNIHQKVYSLPGMQDHRENSDDSVAVQYGPSHTVRPVPGSWFADLLQTDEFFVNSLHGQGLDKLGAGIEALAHAEDGLVEAIHMPNNPVFNLGVQWHPEWETAKNQQSIRIFEAFGAACYKRAGL